MKPTLFLTIFTASAIALTRAGGQQPTTGADHEALLYRLYPDLASHKEVTNAAMAALMADGYTPESKRGLFAKIAANARAVLQAQNPRSTRLQDDAEFTLREEAARAEAQRMFPQVLVPDSTLIRRVLQERISLLSTYPAYFADPKWPLYLTQSCAAAIEEDAKQRMATIQQQAPVLQPGQQQTLTFEQMQQLLELYTKLQQLNNRDDQQSLDMIQQLQALRGGRSRPRFKQTPAEANAWWQQYQQQQKLSELQSEVERLRLQQKR